MERGAEPEKYMMVYRSMGKAPAEHYGGGVVSPEYRLAKRAPHPAALEDCYAAIMISGNRDLVGMKNGSRNGAFDAAGLKALELMEDAAGLNMLLVEHSEYAQSADGLENARIIRGDEQDAV